MIRPRVDHTVPDSNLRNDEDGSAKRDTEAGQLTDTHVQEVESTTQTSSEAFPASVRGQGKNMSIDASTTKCDDHHLTDKAQVDMAEVRMDTDDLATLTDGIKSLGTDKSLAFIPRGVRKKGK